MAASPALWAVFGDVMLCLGAGLLLAAVRDAAGLVLRSALCCFVLDCLAFAAAAFVLCGFAASASASGIARWYMAAGMALGAAGWYAAVSRALHAALRGAAAGTTRLLGQIFSAPLRRIAAQNAKRQQIRAEKKSKKTKNVLQKDSRILYN